MRADNQRALVGLKLAGFCLFRKVVFQPHLSSTQALSLTPKPRRLKEYSSYSSLSMCHSPGHSNDVSI
jgi:hypothetical protein